MKPKLLKICLIIAMTFIALMMFTGCGDEDSSKEDFNEYQQVVVNYFKAISKGDAESYMECMPPQMINYYDIEEPGFYKNLVEDMSKGLQEKYGDDIKMSFEFKDEKKYSDDELKSLEAQVLERYSKEIEFSQGYELKVKMDIKGSDKEDTETQVIKVCMVEYKWYVIDV